MPITLLQSGERAVVKRIGGSPETKKHLADLGFVPDTEVTVVQSQGGNLIVNVKDSRLALTQEMAQKIIVEVI